MSPTSKDDSQNACYVCFEDNAPKSQCACNTYIHDACLLKTITYTNKPYCCICKDPYKNIVTNAIIHHRLHVEFRIVLILLFVSVVGVICGTAALIASHVQYDEEHAQLYRGVFVCAGVLYLIAILGLVMSAYTLISMFRRGVPLWLECYRVNFIRLIPTVQV